MTAPAGPGGRRARIPGTVPGRQHRVVLPAGLVLLSLNDRLHWAERNRRGQAIKAITWALALQQGKVLPKGLLGVHVTVTYRPPPVSRRRDHDNVPTASGKYAIDGLVAAGVLADDCPPHILPPIRYEVDQARPVPGGQLILTITEGTLDG